MESSPARREDPATVRRVEVLPPPRSVAENESRLAASKRRRKKIRINAIGDLTGKPRRGVKLQAPGLNFATVGAVVMLLVHLLISLTGGVATVDGTFHPLLQWGATSWSQFASGQVWGLVTHLFLHGNWGHVVLNAVFFYYVAARLAHVLSQKKVALLFFVSGAGAALIHIGVQRVFPDFQQGWLVGASGGVMGLFLAQTSLFPDSRMLALPVSAMNMGRGVVVASLLLTLVTPGLHLPIFEGIGRFMVSVFGPEIFQIGHLYHAAGAVIGVSLIPWCLPKLITLNQLHQERSQREDVGG